jgi:aminoglycoside phosphotransferase (APT) family kinase protein
VAFKNTIDPEQARAALTRWIASNMPGAESVEVSGVTIPTASGMSCQTVLLEADWVENGAPQHHRLVARVAPHPDEKSLKLFPEYDLEIEARIMQALHDKTDVPAPNVLFSETDPSVLGGPFLIMERIDGRVPPDDPPYTVAGWLLELSPEEQRTLIDNTLGVLAALHSTDWRGLGLDALDRSERGALGAEQYIAEIEYLYTTGAEGRPHPTLEAGIAWAREHRPSEEGEMVLNWGDTRIGNILFADDLSVAAVLDWEMATVGSRDQDLAYLIFNLEFFTTGLGAPSPPGFPSEAEMVERYEALTGHTVQNLDYFKALSSLLGAVMLMRVGYVMIAGGLLPADSPMPHNNPGSQVMAQYMGLPAPTGDLTDWTGVR